MYRIKQDNLIVMTYIYENKHLVNALLDAAVCLAAMALSIIVIAIALSPSFFHTTILAEDWLWYLLVTLAIITFKDGYITKGRQFIYPVYKDDKQNKRRFFKNYIDGILTNYLTMKHDDLLAELKSHLGS